MRRRSWRYLWLVIILGLGLLLRTHDLIDTPPSGDEAESAINAMTILQTGLPRGEYVGIPIYENVLTEPWRDHPEYEFRDSSYSAKGLAIYHGWLPLYAMAASMKAFGVTPDDPPQEMTVRPAGEQIERRVIAPRVPSVIFSAFFLLALFLAARDMFGTDAAFAALAVGAVCRPFVIMGREARYHSATLALTTGCCWIAWRVYRDGRWRDYIFAAILLVLLFYTHLLAFMISVVMFTIMSLLGRKRKGMIVKLATTGLVVAACAAPWVILSGFLEQTSHIPPAREFLSFPADLIYYPLRRIPYLAIPLAGLIWLMIVFAFHRRIPKSITAPLDRHQRQIAFLLAWIAIGITMFTMLVPAASYFYKRLTLAVAGPGVVWGAMIVAAAARSWRREYSAVVAPIAFVLIILSVNMAYVWFLEPAPRGEAYDLIARLREMQLAPDTRLYCTPNDQLTLTYLTGLPVQSVAPVRKSFIDTYPGPMVIIEATPPYDWVPAGKIRRIARDAGHELTMEQAKALQGPLNTRQLRKDVASRVVSLEPVDFVEPEYAEAVTDYQLQSTAQKLANSARAGSNNPMVRGIELKDNAQWWPVFFYRFVDPALRMGGKLNYAERIKSARAEVLPSGWVVFRCPPLHGRDSGRASP